MKKLLYTNLWSRLMVLFAILSMSAVASAEDLGELQLDTDYALSDFHSYEGYFVAPTSGKLTYTDMLEPFYDAAHENPVSSNYEGYINGLSCSSIQVSAGVTYYFYSSFLWSGGNFRLSMDIPFDVDFRSHEEGATLSCTGRGAIEFRMTDRPTFSGVKFVCDGQEYDWNGITVVRDKYIVVEYAASLLSILEATPDLVGKPCQVVFSGLAVDDDDSQLYNGDGVLTFNFVVGPLPTRLVDQNLSTSTIDSWFRPSEEKGLFYFTFSNNIKSGSIVMGYGANVESDNYYTETPEMTIAGNMVTVDLRGMQRRLELQEDDYGNPCQFYFKLQSFIDVDDQYIYSTDQGSLGSVSFNVPYNLITTNLTADFDPEEGSELSSNGIIQIYFTPAEDVLFDGAKFSWAGGSATVAHEDLRIEYDDYHGCSVNFDIPAEAAAARNVNVSLTGLDTPDGLDYTSYVTAVFNTAETPEFSISLVSPEDGASLAGFVANESRILVYAENVPTDADELEIVARIYDPSAEDPIYTTYLWAAEPADDETLVYNYGQTIYESLDFIQGVDYTINISVDKITYPAAGGRDVENIASNNYTIHGTAAPFAYSEVSLTGITPNPVTTDIISTDQNVITLTFDGPVTVTKAGTPIGMGGGLSQWTRAQLDDEGLQWSITIPNSVIENSKSSFGVSFWAVDADGNPVYKTTVEGLVAPTQNKENTYFNFDYVCTVGAPDFVVDPVSETELEVLDKIYVSYSAGIDPNWNQTLPITLYKGKGTNQEMIQEWTPDYFDMWNDDVCVEYGEVNLKWCIILDTPITDPGYYTFVFPNAFFNLGSEFDQASSRITNVHYIIPEPVVADNVTTDPAVGSTVSSLKTIKVTWVDASDAGVDYNVTDPVVLYNDANEVVCNAGIDMSEDWDDPWNMLVVTLDQEIDTDGTYVLHIPAGKVLLNDGSKSSTEQYLSYTVKTDTGISSVLAAEDGAYRVYNLQGVLMLSTTSAADLKTLAPGFYIINGRKVRVNK